MVKQLIKTQANGVTKFINNNFWNLVCTLVAIAFAWATLNARVLALEIEKDRMSNHLNRIDQAIERIIVLEEHDKAIAEDLIEIKADIKDIKRSLNLH